MYLVCRLLLPTPVGSTPFPYTTLFRSWVNALNHGETPEQVAYGFAASAEREGNRVRADYQTFLGRTPAPSEVTSWVKAFSNGLTNESLVDRKSTRLNSSHRCISYAVFCFRHPSDPPPFPTRRSSDLG